MLAITASKFRRLTALIVFLGVLSFWHGAASADSFSFAFSLGSPPPVVIYPAPRVIYPAPVIVEHYPVYRYYHVETYPVYHYHYRRGGPPPWAPAHGHWKKHWRHED